MDLDEIFETFTPMIDGKIKEIIHTSKFPNLYDGMSYAIETGGKRLRPILCLAVCKVLNGDVEKALPFATSIELIHNFTLIHDDIEDGDEIRRNHPSVWKKYSIAHGINIGDGMIFKAYECFLKSNLPPEKILELTEMLTNSVIEIIEGQNMEFNFRERDDVSIKEYENMAVKKAGMLIGLALCSGAFIANASGKIQKILMEYGKKIGLAFQIRDDVLNLTGDQNKYGKEIYGDIKEGKRTLIIIHCLTKCSNTEKGNLLKILKKGRLNISRSDTDFVMDLIKKYDSIKFAMEFYNNLVEESKKSLKEIDDENLRKLLVGFSDFMIKRKY